MKKLTTAEFIQRAKEVHGDKYDYSLVEYVNNETKVKIICPIHGVFEQKPHDHLQKCGCQKCNNHLSLTIEKFTQKANKIHNFKYNYNLVDYKNNKTKVKIICPIHGVFEQYPTHHLQGAGCKKCSNVYKPNTEEFIQKAKEIHRDKYDYSLVDYKNAHTKVKIICPIHGKFDQAPAEHIRGNGCPKCNSSHGENRIRNFLKDNQVFFEEQKRFDDLGKLSYDFYIPSKNFLIEFNGRQHYEEWCFKHHNLKKQRHNDWLKRKYARDNNIKLLTIPYWELENIESILETTIYKN